MSSIVGDAESGAASVGRSVSVSNSDTVQKIVLTGGPCGGKTTALERIRGFLSQYGVRVYTVPEAATILWTGGISPADMKSGDDWAHFQATLMKTQIFLEDTFYRMAVKSGEKSILLCDRGAMDGKAYVDDDTWSKILSINSVLDMDICDSRYNAVLHLVTAADNAETFYSDKTNSTRRESAEEARVLDKNVLRSWMPHPKQFVFGNKGVGFEQKMSKVISCVCQLCGLPVTARKARKFLLKNCSVPADVKTACFDIEKIYPCQPEEKSGSGYTFVRKRTNVLSKGAIHSYGFTRVRMDEASGEKIEVKRILTAGEYALHCGNPDPVRHTVKQHRISFLLNESTCYICKYVAPEKVKGLQILYVQTAFSGGESRSGLEFPDWLNIEREVTGEKSFSSYTMSMKDRD